MALMNEGPVDRLVRTAVGIGITSMYFIGPKSPWAFVGLIPLITGVVGFCPLYRLFRFSTKRAQSA